MTGKAPKGKGCTIRRVAFFYVVWLQIHVKSAWANDLVADFSDVAWLA